MKCLRLTGTASIVDRFVMNFSTALPGKRVCVISECVPGDCEISFPGQSSPIQIMRSLPPDIVLLRSSMRLAIPTVHCGSETISDESLLMFRYNGEATGIDYADIYRNTFDLLPQKTASECGRCGLDCMQFASDVLHGRKSEKDCFFAPDSVEVTLGGRNVELGQFPLSIIEGTVRGLVSSLKGYSSEEDISIRIKH